LQRRVDQLAGIYHELVASARGMTVAKVRGLQADTFYGYDALDAGLADDVMSLEELLTVIRARLDGLRATA
jgi:ClpP class serine protease